MEKEKINEWYKLYTQYKNGYHMESYEWQELARLNYQIMEVVHKIHNDHMLDKKEGVNA